MGEPFFRSRECLPVSWLAPISSASSDIIRALVVLAILSFSETVLPCHKPPSELFRDHAILAKDATMIVVVEVVSSSPISESTCKFRVIDVLKGTVPEQLPIDCRLAGAGNWMTHFSGHSDAKFWLQRGGRLGIKSDCTLIPPAFEIGHYYLLLLGGAPDTKQFEELASPFDKWLLFIQKQITRSKLDAQL